MCYYIYSFIDSESFLPSDSRGVGKYGPPHPTSHRGLNEQWPVFCNINGNQMSAAESAVHPWTFPPAFPSSLCPLEPHPCPGSPLRVWHSQARTTCQRQQETPSGIWVQSFIVRMASNRHYPPPPTPQWRARQPLGRRLSFLLCEWNGGMTDGLVNCALNSDF